MSFQRANDNAVGLRHEAGLALNNTYSSTDPKISEEEYDTMINVVAGLPEKTPEPTKEQLEIWSAAVKITGVDYMKKD